MTVPTSADDPGWDQPVYPDRPKPAKQHGGLGLLVVAVIIFGFAWACMAAASGGRSSTDDTEVDEATAIRACQNSVEAQLRAPATAEYGGEAAVREVGGVYEVTGHVDAENGFDALVRNLWMCTARPTADGYRAHAVLIGE